MSNKIHFKQEVLELVCQNMAFHHVSLDRVKMYFEKTSFVKFLMNEDTLFQKDLLFWTNKTIDEIKNMLQQNPATLDEMLINYHDDGQRLPELDWGDPVGHEVI